MTLTSRPGAPCEQGWQGRDARLQTRLLAGPEGLRLEDGGHGDLAVPVLQPHQDVHEDVARDEGVALSHQPAAQQRVLHDANHRLVALQAQDI